MHRGCSIEQPPGAENQDDVNSAHHSSPLITDSPHRSLPLGGRSKLVLVRATIGLPDNQFSENQFSDNRAQENQGQIGVSAVKFAENGKDWQEFFAEARQRDRLVLK